MASRLRFGGPTSNPEGGSDGSPSVSGKAAGEREGEARMPEPRRREVTDLGGGSEVVHIPRFLPRERAWEWFEFLDKTIPWTRPEIRVFGRSAIQVRAVSIAYFMRRVRLRLITHCFWGGCYRSREDPQLFVKNQLLILQEKSFA